jgi:putative membrane protein insertion efficiency factor
VLREVLSRLVLGGVVVPIRFYQRFISPLFPRRCKYEPTCSAYALEAVRSYGVLRGLVLAGWRLMRCNPFSHGGYDPPEAQRLFARSSQGSAQRLGRRRAAARPASRAET